MLGCGWAEATCLALAQGSRLTGASRLLPLIPLQAGLGSPTLGPDLPWNRPLLQPPANWREGALSQKVPKTRRLCPPSWPSLHSFSLQPAPFFTFPICFLIFLSLVLLTACFSASLWPHLLSFCLSALLQTG